MNRAREAPPCISFRLTSLTGRFHIARTDRHGSHASAPDFQQHPERSGSLRPRRREGRLRPCHGRDAARHSGSRHHRRRPGCPAQPRAPRGRRVRRRNRRRRRDPDAGPRRVLPRRRALRASRGGPLRRRHRVPPGRRRRARHHEERDRVDRRLRVPPRARLARGPDPRPRAGQPRPRGHAGVRAALRRPRPPWRRRASRGHRTRPPGVPPAQARRARARLLLHVALGPHHGLQGHGHDAPARAVLPRPLRRAGRLEARDRPLALLHEHVPVVAARAAVPHDRPQRRDQHRARQPQLDARAPVAA